MNIDFTKNEYPCCPYCELALYYHQGRFYCPDCKKDFDKVTGHELDKDGNFIYEEKK